MNLLLAALPLLGALLSDAPPCQRSERWRAMETRECWAWIVMGESGGHFPEGSSLVAWTLRSWEVYQDMPADEAGRLWGWYGWAEPNTEAWAAMDSAFGQPLLLSPYRFMRLGAYCKRLGSASDVRLWNAMGAWGRPDITIPNPAYPHFSINCYLSDPLVLADDQYLLYYLGEREIP